MLTQMLSLSDAQAQKVLDIVLDFNIQIQKIREIQPESTPWTPDEKLIEKRNASLKEVLTPEQFENLCSLRWPKDKEVQEIIRGSKLQGKISILSLYSIKLIIWKEH